MKIGTWIVSFVLFLGSAWFVYESTNLSGGVSLGEPGPGRMPIAVGVATMLLSGALIVYTSLAKTGETVRFPYLFNIGLFTVLVVVYGLIISYIGYYASTGLFLFAIMVLLRTRWQTAAAVTVGFLAFVFLIFDKLLTVPLP
ncbi:MAG: tripartite tricarboxylate transporter TctB family protein [Rhodospirillales bacterium]|jgi:hypothetical protein|nr:tripartite tricarboxylate transporter TctB family protein [Rhodospirillales bacterium]